MLMNVSYFFFYHDNNICLYMHHLSNKESMQWMFVLFDDDGVPI